MKFMRCTAKYTWMAYKRNEDTLKELKTKPILDKILKYKNNWLQHVNRMQRDRLPKLLKTTHTVDKETLEDHRRGF